MSKEYNDELKNLQRELERQNADVRERGNWESGGGRDPEQIRNDIYYAQQNLSRAESSERQTNYQERYFAQKTAENTTSSTYRLSENIGRTKN